MLVMSRRYSVMAVIILGILLSIFDTSSGTPRIIWLGVPLVCFAVLIGEGITGIIHCGYRDRNWILVSSIVLLVCSIITLIFGTKAAHVFAGLGAEHAGPSHGPRPDRRRGTVDRA